MAFGTGKVSDEKLVEIIRENFGGITGYATGTITGCYNGGAITGNGYVAGIVETVRLEQSIASN